MRSGRDCRICAFAAIVTGVSVIPDASFASVFPVQGQIISASSGRFRTERLRAGYCRDRRFFADIRYFADKSFGCPETRVGGEGIEAHHRKQVVSALCKRA